MSPYQLRDITVQPGCRYDGRLSMFEFSDGSTLDLPIIIVHGAQPGETVYAGAGAHGDEINTVLATLDALALIDPDRVHGTIVAVPVENPYGYRYRRRLFDMNQSDSETLNLHRVFPGKPDGDPHERMAHFLFTLMQESGASFFFDLHTGTTGSFCPPHTFVPSEEFGLAASEALEAAHAFNAGLIVQASAGVYAHGGMPHIVLPRRLGLPVLGTELGEGGYVNEQFVEIGVRGILNVLRYRGVLQDGVAADVVDQPILKQVIYVRANRGGLLEHLVRPGEWVEGDQPLARILNLYGAQVELVRAPISGYVITSAAYPTTHEGERICRIGVPSDGRIPASFRT